MWSVLTVDLEFDKGPDFDILVYDSMCDVSHVSGARRPGHHASGTRVSGWRGELGFLICRQ